MNTSVCHRSVRNRDDRGSGGRGDYIGCGGSGNGGNIMESSGSSDGGSVDSMNTSVNVGDVGGDGGGGGGRYCGGIDFWHTIASWCGDGIEIDHQFI